MEGQEPIFLADELQYTKKKKARKPVTDDGTNASGSTSKVSDLSGINKRLHHVRDAIEDLKKAPILAVLIAAVVLFIGFIAEQFLSEVYERFKPDSLKSEAEIVSESLLQKSEGIEAKVNEISALIEAIQDGDSPDANLLEEKMKELLESIDAIKPDLSEVVSLRGDLFLVAARQKNNDIEIAGMSPKSDVTVRMNDGVTICKERYTLAISHRGNTGTSRPRVGLTSPTGENVVSIDMQTGASILIDDAIGLVSVSFMRHEMVGDEALYGFNFTCPS